MNFLTKKFSPAQQVFALIATLTLVFSLLSGAFPALAVQGGNGGGNGGGNPQPQDLSVYPDVTVCTYNAGQDSYAPHVDHNSKKIVLGTSNYSNDDIIPSFDYKDEAGIDHTFSGQNYSGDYLTIYNNGGCDGVVHINEVPVITLLGSDTVEVVVGGVYGLAEDDGATADDAEDGDITENIVVGGLPVDTSATGTHYVTYNVTDSDDADAEEVIRTVTVIEANGGGNGEDNGGGNDNGNGNGNGGNGNGNGNGDLSDYPSITICRLDVHDEYQPHPVNSNGVKDIVVSAEYDATDIIPAFDYVDENGDDQTFEGHLFSGGYVAVYNEGECDGTFVNTLPVITLTGDAVVEVEVGATYTDAGATADDAEEGDITASIVTTGLPVDTSAVGSFEVKYNVTDSNGGAAVEVVRTVNVVEECTSNCGGGEGDDEYEITGYVWRDRDRDGEDDGGDREGRLAGVTIKATNGTDDYTAETDADGYYVITVPAGTWTVTTSDSRWKVTHSSFTYTIVAPTPVITQAPSLLGRLASMIVPTAYAAVVETFQGNNFGVTPVGGGGGGSSSHNNSAPTPEVLGASTSVLPAGAPNTGAGGTSTSPIATLISLLGMLMSLVTIRATKNVSI